MILDLLYFLSSDESYLLNDESDDDGSGSVSSGKYSFPFCFDGSVGRVRGLGYGVFLPTGVGSKCDVFVFVVLITIVVKYKGG